MEQHEEMEMQIWEYIDNTCDNAARQRISILLAQDVAWREKYDGLLALHSGISESLEMEQPSMRFTKNVMEAVAGVHMAPATKKYINKAVIRGIAAFFIITIGLSVGYAIATADWHFRSFRHSHGVKSDELGFLFNSNVFNLFVAINVVLALLLVDKLLRKRTQTH
jgi:hypothetical protein